MKRIFIVLTLITVCFFAFANEDAELYSFLYKNTDTVTGRLGVLRSALNAQLDGAGEFYLEALDLLLLNMSNLRTPLEREAADDSAIILVNLLGKEKYTEAANSVLKVVDTFQNPIVRAEAMISLGSMQAKAFLPQVITVLNSQNMSPTQDPDIGEKLAYGAIISLEKYKDISGYLPVFFASIGWYSVRIKDAATNTMPIISVDPSEPLLDLINSSAYNYEAKYNALRAIDASAAPGEAKVNIATAAYQQGWLASTSVQRERLLLNNIRKYAMGMIKDQRTGNTDIYRLLERSYKEGVDWEEKLGAISTLSAIATQESAQLLSNFLLALNGRRQSGLTNQEDERMVREVIPALGDAGQSAGRRALQVVSNNDSWPTAVRSLASENLAKLR